jgi:integrase
MPKNKLTNHDIAKLKPTLYDQTLSDGDCLYVCLDKHSDIKYFRMLYSSPTLHKQRKMRLGKYPARSLAQARIKRDEAASLIAQGLDPADHKKQVKQEQLKAKGNTFRAIAKEWLDKQETVNWQSTFDKKRMLVEKHLLPFIGRIPVSEITMQQAVKVLQPIADAQHWESLDKTCRYFKNIMERAIDQQLAPDINWSRLRKQFGRGVTKKRPHVKVSGKAYESGTKRLKHIIAGVLNYNMQPITAMALMTSMYTTLRVGAVVKVEWSDIDFDEGAWSVDPRKDKFAYKKLMTEEIIEEKTITFPIPKQVLEILRLMESVNMRHKGNDFIFHGIGKSGHLTTVAMSNIFREAGFSKEQSIHGFRHVGSTLLNEQFREDGSKVFDKDVIEVALQHSGSGSDKDKIRAVYNEAEYWKPRELCLQFWADYIQDIIGATPQEVWDRKCKA